MSTHGQSQCWRRNKQHWLHPFIFFPFLLLSQRDGGLLLVWSAGLVPSKHLIEIESFSSWAHINPGKGKYSKITFARDWGSPQIIEDNVVIRDFPLGCQGPSANSWCLGWLAQRPQDLRHIYAQLLPGSALLSKYRSHISGIQCSSWSFCPFKTRSYWIFVQLAGCVEDKYLSVVLLSICFASRVPWNFDTNTNRKFEIRWRLAKQTLSSHSRFLWASALIISRHLGGGKCVQIKKLKSKHFSHLLVTVDTFGFFCIAHFWLKNIEQFVVFHSADKTTASCCDTGER